MLPQWPPELTTIDHRTDHRSTALAEYIRRVVDEAPPLTAHQRSRLAVLLHPTAQVSRPAPVIGRAA